MEKVRFGIIGTGNQGSFYASLFHEGSIKNGVLTAVCDINDKKLDALYERFEDCKATRYRDYKSLLDSGLCDAVLVETPHYDHPEICMEAMKRGIHVICDKPAGVYTKQVRELNEFAQKCNVRFSMMYNQRTNSVYRKMREIIQSGGIGSLQRINWIITDWYRTDFYYSSGSWRASWLGEGGGVLINQCPHQLDLLCWIIGEMPKTVRGFCQYGKWHDIEVEDDVTAYLTYEGGATGVFITTTGEAPGTNRFEIAGTGGKLLCENNKLFWYKNAQDTSVHLHTATSGYNKPDIEITEVETDGINPQHRGIINNFANSLLGLEEQFVDGTEGIMCVELMNAIELSGWNGGEEITLPIDEERYLKELNEKCSTSRLNGDDKLPVADMSTSF